MARQRLISSHRSWVTAGHETESEAGLAGVCAKMVRTDLDFAIVCAGVYTLLASNSVLPFFFFFFFYVVSTAQGQTKQKQTNKQTKNEELG